MYSVFDYLDKSIISDDTGKDSLFYSIEILPVFTFLPCFNTPEAGGHFSLKKPHFGVSSGIRSLLVVPSPHRKYVRSLS